MANVVITSTTNSIKLDNGVYEGATGAYGIIQKKGTFRKDDVFRVSLAPSETWVEVLMKTFPNVSIRFAYTSTTGAFTVDSIDGNTPSSNSDLYDKFIALII
jgi:hypothetical protein